MSIRPLHGRWWVACALVGACCGCSLIVDTGNLVVRCEIRPDGGADPCAAVGLTCTDGTCQACKPVAELCDKLDNDCDGKIDEGFEAVPELCNGVDDNCNGVTDEGFDPDKDDFTWCGGGDPKLVDCAPDDPSIHPPKANPDGSTTSPPELCDGKDNDCDGKIDEDRTCAPLRSCAQSGCSGGLTCDPVRNQCVAPQSSGSTCMSDAQCGSGFCVGMAAIGLGSSIRNNLCGAACCKDQDCSEGSVCVQSGTGARVCLPAEVAGRKRAMTGASCQQSADCASGVCQRGICVATCSRDADCSGQACRLNSGSSLLMGAGAWICGSPAGRGVPGDLCTSFDPTSCQSALCSGLLCTAPCGSDADCGEGLACRYLSVQGLLGGGRVTACVTPDPMQQPPGSTCCTNADCGQGDICKPVQTNRDWGMYCQSGGGVQ